MNFTLSPRQAAVHRLVTDDAHRIKILSGAIRSGKTHVGLDAWIVDVMRRFRGQQFMLSAMTAELIRDNLVPKVQETAWERGVESRYVPSRAELLIGDNKFLLKSGKDRRAASNIQGLTLAGAYLDEAVNLSQRFIQEVNGRCSVDGASIVLNCNPSYPGHWIKKEWIDEAFNLGIASGTLTIFDNPSLSVPYIREQMVTRTGADLDRAVWGRWTAETGLVWPEWALDTPPGTPPTGWYLGVDYGEADPTHAVLIGVWGNVAYAVDEWRWAHREQGQISPDAQVEGIREMVGGREIRGVAVDPHGLSIIPSLKNAWPRRVYEGRGKPGDLKPTLSYTGALLRAGELRISPRCGELIRELGSYRWKKPTEMGAGPETPVDFDNHGCDALRYYCSVLHAPATRPRRPHGLRMVG